MKKKPKPPAGKRFSKTHQPSKQKRKGGRKPNILSQVSEITGENFKAQLSNQDYQQIFKSMLEMSADEIGEIYKDEKRPYFMRVLAGAMIEETKRNDLSIAGQLFDRVLGRATQPITLPPPRRFENTPSPDLAAAAARYKEIFKRDK